MEKPQITPFYKLNAVSTIHATRRVGMSRASRCSGGGGAECGVREEARRARRRREGRRCGRRHRLTVRVRVACRVVSVAVRQHRPTVQTSTLETSKPKARAPTERVSGAKRDTKRKAHAKRTTRNRTRDASKGWGPTGSDTPPTRSVRVPQTREMRVTSHATSPKQVRSASERVRPTVVAADTS